jgi:hypothetical protein
MKKQKMRSFIYLDEYKMYSLSSQIFEGLTESIVDEEKSQIQDSDSQKGKIGSGRLMANIIRNESLRSEKKFIHDYSYTLFEDALKKKKKFLEITSSNLQEKISLIDKYDFIKIRGQAIFNDAKLIASTLENFNSFAGALGYMQYKELADQEALIKEEVKQVKDRNQRAKAKAKFNKNVFNDFLKEQGLYLDERYIEEMVKIINFGYKGQFETQFPFLLNDDGVLFNSIINRNYLKESEEFLISKYSRETEKEFCLFGIITQTKNVEEKSSLSDFISYLNENHSEFDDDGNEISLGMKHAIMGIVNALMNVENTFIGKAKYEYIIDPISIYREL